MPKISDLGELSGEVLLFGGPYSNFQALGAMMELADARDIDASRRICTGDIVAYCADPVACVAKMRQLGNPIARGNCEVQLAQDALDCGCGFAAGTLCSILSEGWFSYARAQISNAERRWMAALPDWLIFRHYGKRYVVIHGAASDISRYLWSVSEEQYFTNEINLIIQEIDPIDGVICGHSGLAFSREINGVQWINAGAIGMPPHDGSRQTCFAILGPDGLKFERLSYDVSGAIKAMQNAGLNQGYEQSLRSGYWPSEDVLPATLRHPLASG
ncbi:MAG: metallophosphoesterase family protein [Alphaproteobacteria bacterium]|nr:metallophosphoesterase family protein [Alphaproteobacteria bacterium]